MNQRAIIEKCEYHLLEILPSLGGQGQYIVCKDADGSKFVCPEDFWLRHAPEPEVTAPVHTGSTSQEKIDFFYIAVPWAGKCLCQALL